MSGLQFLPMRKRAQTANASPVIVRISPMYAAGEVAGNSCQDNGSLPKPRENRSHHPIQTIHTEIRDAPSEWDSAVCFTLIRVTNHRPNMTVQEIQITW